MVEVGIHRCIKANLHKTINTDGVNPCTYILVFRSIVVVVYLSNLLIKDYNCIVNNGWWDERNVKHLDRDDEFVLFKSLGISVVSDCHCCLTDSVIILSHLALVYFDYDSCSLAFLLSVDPDASTGELFVNLGIHNYTVTFVILDKG